MAAELKPTRGESLLLERRRKAENQLQAAARYGVHVDTYRAWETDERPEDVPPYNAGHLKPHEVCLLRRRRSGKTQREVAAALGMTRLWVIKMELGEASVDRLKGYWETQA